MTYPADWQAEVRRQRRRKVIYAVRPRLPNDSDGRVAANEP